MALHVLQTLLGQSTATLSVVTSAFTNTGFVGLHIDILTTKYFLQFLGPHTSAYIPDPSSCTHLVFPYFVALFQCFRMVPVSCSSRGANKNVQQKSAPLLHAVRSNRSCTTASLHQVVRGYNLKRWISVVDSLIYKNNWQSSFVPRPHPPKTGKGPGNTCKLSRIC